jgi:thioredoxin reductase (NADPH)
LIEGEMMYDLVIIGSGPAGLSAAVYAKRACLDLVVLEKEPMGGGQIITTEQVDNYLGLPGIGGFELAQQFEDHARNLDVPFKEGVAEELVKVENGWKIRLQSGEVLESKTVLLATGAVHRKLGVSGEDALSGMGVSYCATCDGAFFRDKTVAVVGGGDVALEDALYLAKSCQHVYLIHRRKGLRAAKVLQERVFASEKITFLPDNIVQEIHGTQKVEGITILDKETDIASELALDGVFLAVGMDPRSELVKGIAKTEKGYVCADETGITTQPGLFVAGDVRTKPLRQIVTAVSDGANAVTSITEYLLKK